MGISAGIAAIGAVVTGVGAYESYSAAKDSAAANSKIAQDQQAQNALSQQAMELNARRQQLETIRNSQKARALALSDATAQGAGQGSGLQGGYGQVQGDADTTLLGIQQQLSLGQQNFSIDADITSQKIALANAQSKASFGQGLTSLGGALISNSGTIGNISQGFGKTSSAIFGTGGPFALGSSSLSYGRSF
jgi:hypothetical protein